MRQAFEITGHALQKSHGIGVLQYNPLEDAVARGADEFRGLYYRMRGAIGGGLQDCGRLAHEASSKFVRGVPHVINEEEKRASQVPRVDTKVRTRRRG
jgi:hypothetical protein